MNADAINRRDPTGSFRFAGAGHAVARRCSKCNSQPVSQAGGTSRKIGTQWFWFCAECNPKRKAA